MRVDLEHEIVIEYRYITGGSRGVGVGVQGVQPPNSYGMSDVNPTLLKSRIHPCIYLWFVHKKIETAIFSLD